MATTKWLVDWRSPMDQWGAGEPQRPCHRPFRFPFFLLFNVFFSYFSFPFPTAVPSLLRSRSVSLFRFFFIEFTFTTSPFRADVFLFIGFVLVCVLLFFYWLLFIECLPSAEFLGVEISSRSSFVLFFRWVSLISIGRSVLSWFFLFCFFIGKFILKNGSRWVRSFFLLFLVVVFFFWFFNDENVSKKSLKKNRWSYATKKKKTDETAALKKKLGNNTVTLDFLSIVSISTQKKNIEFL